MMRVRRQWGRRLREARRHIGGSLMAIILCLPCAPVSADSPGELLSRYADEARRENSGFTGFSAARGQDFYYRSHRLTDDSEYSCASCHHQDPRKEQFAHHDKIPCRACHYPDQYRGGGHTIRRQLLPFAPIANEARFTDPIRVEKWFKKNCEFVLERACTATEKGDLIQWLLSIPGTP